MKRQLLMSKILSVLVTLSCSLTLHAENNITYTATYYGNLTIGNDTLGGLTYKTVHYDGLCNVGNPGMPSLPVDYIRFSVPWNATNFTVTAELGSSMGYNYRDLIYPCQPPRMMSDTTPPTITLPNMSAYADYPQQNAWVVDEGFLAGENHIVTVAVMPFSYKLTSLSYLLEKYQQVNITLSYQQSNSLATYPIVNLNEHTKAAGYRLTESIVVNPNNVSEFAPQSMSDTLIRPYHAPSINSGLPEYPYLIVTTPELLHSLRRLTALKRQKGYNVKLATVDEIMHDTYAQYGDIINVNGIPTVTFSDSAGIIRQYLKLSKWFFGTKYLLLVGSEVPYRIQWKGLPIGTYDVPTDLYYSDLTGNWTHNSTIDLYPDLFV